MWWLLNLWWHPLYLAGLGRKLILPPGPLQASAARAEVPLSDTFKVISFHRSAIATSTNEDDPYLSRYPSYHSWRITTNRPQGTAASEKDFIMERNILEAIEGGRIGPGPMTIGTGFGAVVFKRSTGIKLFETLRILYTAYLARAKDDIQFLRDESKFLVSLSNAYNYVAGQTFTHFHSGCHGGLYRT